MIGIWLFAIIIAIGGICLSAWFVCIIKEDGYSAPKIAAIFATIIITIAIVFGLLYYLYNSESGKRLIKDYESDLNGGIERTVTVYDINGEVIAEYSGKFDVDYDSERIKFDDENGKRHIIYYTTGTVIIDEE